MAAGADISPTPKTIGARHDAAPMPQGGGRRQSRASRAGQQACALPQAVMMRRLKAGKKTATGNMLDAAA